MAANSRTLNKKEGRRNVCFQDNSSIKNPSSLILRCVPSVSRNLLLLQPFHPCTTISKTGAFIFNLQSRVLLTHHHWHCNRYCHCFKSLSLHPSSFFPLFSFFSILSLLHISDFCISLPFVSTAS